LTLTTPRVPLNGVLKHLIDFNISGAVFYVLSFFVAHLFNLFYFFVNGSLIDQ